MTDSDPLRGTLVDAPVNFQHLAWAALAGMIGQNVSVVITFSSAVVYSVSFSSVSPVPPPPPPTPLPSGTVGVLPADIPTLVYLPHESGDTEQTGTLVAAGQYTNGGGLVLRRSEDGGASWGNNITYEYPHPQQYLVMQPQLGYDNMTKMVFLSFTFVQPTPNGGGCDM